MTRQLTLQDAIDAADPTWMAQGFRAIEALCAQRRTFDAWDLSLMGLVDPPSPAGWGALFRAAKLAGLIRPVGFAPSRRPSVRGSVSRLWRAV